MDTAAEPRIRAVLEADERLLWTGRPSQGLAPFFRDWRPLASLVAFLAIVLLWLSTMLHDLHGQLRWDRLLFPPVLMGLFTLNVLIDRSQRARTYYGVTDRRALVVRDDVGPLMKALMWPYRPFQSIALSDLTGVSLRRPVGGSASIHFDGAWTAWFTHLDDAEKVYALIQEIRGSKAAPGDG